jgi:hypothetical protein
MLDLTAHQPAEKRVRVMADGIRTSPSIACTTSSVRSRSTWAKRRPPVSTATKNASTKSTTGI